MGQKRPSSCAQLPSKRKRLASAKAVEAAESAQAQAQAQAQVSTSEQTHQDLPATASDLISSVAQPSTRLPKRKNRGVSASAKAVAAAESAQAQAQAQATASEQKHQDLPATASDLISSVPAAQPSTRLPKHKDRSVSKEQLLARAEAVVAQLALQGRDSSAEVEAGACGPAAAASLQLPSQAEDLVQLRSEPHALETQDQTEPSMEHEQLSVPSRGKGRLRGRGRCARLP